MGPRNLIAECKKAALEGGASVGQAEKLMDIDNAYLPLLARTADEVTREVRGTKVDVEQLYNIKKKHVQRGLYVLRLVCVLQHGDRDVPASAGK